MHQSVQNVKLSKYILIIYIFKYYEDNINVFIMVFFPYLQIFKPYLLFIIKIFTYNLP